jgi:tRNA pseudouridine13 synthase
MSHPYLTAALPGTGGRIKVYNHDFRVQEIPLYEPSGHGEHTYVTIEKEGLPTLQAIRRIAGALGINPRTVGYAGLKDAHAVTVQTISVGDVPPAVVEKLDLPGIRVLAVKRHTNKLKIGHLRGNQFTIRVRDVPESALPAAQAILDVLARRGAPNYFGEQRFGVRGDTHLLGHALVRRDAEGFVSRFVGMPHPDESAAVRRARSLYEQGDLASSVGAWPASMEQERRVVQALLDHPQDYARALRAVPNNLRRFFVSAYQGALFNRVLVRRLDTLDRLQRGDLAWIHGKGAVFLVENPQAEQARADRLEISPSGPLYGYKLTVARGTPGEMEQQVLDEEGITLEDLRMRGLKLKGARRPLRAPLSEVKTWYDDGLMLSFTLPPGCYATVVLAEVTKAGDDEEEAV